ncbi:MAG: 30S ribosomal protein S7 [Lentisphaeria bacterium]|nr:30S ribosomal protein S7 [Lentisphaeria bacterium]
MRRHQAVKRALIPDVRYNNELVARLINTIMLCGKKSTAQTIVYGAFDILKEKKADMEPLDLFLAALENAKPRLEVKSKRVGGATYQVPLEVPAGRQVALAMRWIVTYARGRKGMDTCHALAAELMDAFNNTGNTIKKRDDVHKMANANKAFAHFR